MHILNIRRLLHLQGRRRPGSLARLHCRHNQLAAGRAVQGKGRFYSAQLSSLPGAAVTVSSPPPVSIPI
eukprot:652335-Hanusia_phi.AAC.1